MKCSVCQKGTIYYGVCDYCGNTTTSGTFTYEPAVPDENFINELRKVAEYWEGRFGTIPVGCVVNKRMWESLEKLPEKEVSGIAHFKPAHGVWLSAQMVLYSGLPCYLDEEQQEDYEMFYDKEKLVEKLKQIKERKKQ